MSRSLSNRQARLAERNKGYIILQDPRDGFRTVVALEHCNPRPSPDTFRNDWKCVINRSDCTAHSMDNDLWHHEVKSFRAKLVNEIKRKEEELNKLRKCLDSLN